MKAILNIKDNKFLKIIIVIVFIQFTMGSLNAQKIFKCCRITFKDSGITLKGVITGVTDTSIQFYCGDISDTNQQYKSANLSIYSIKKIKCEYRVKGNIPEGILFGMGAGIAFGALIGIAAYQPPSYDWGVPTGGFNATSGGIFGMLSGGLIGGVIGGSNGTHRIGEAEVVHIDGNITKYSQNINTLKMYLVTNK